MQCTVLLLLLLMIHPIQIYFHTFVMHDAQDKPCYKCEMDG